MFATTYPVVNRLSGGIAFSPGRQPLPLQRSVLGRPSSLNLNRRQLLAQQEEAPAKEEGWSFPAKAALAIGGLLVIAAVYHYAGTK